MNRPNKRPRTDYHPRPNSGTRGPREFPQSSSTSDRPQHNRYLTKADLDHLAFSSPSDVATFVSKNDDKFMSAYRHAPFCTNRLTLKRLVKILYILTKCQEIELTKCTLGEILSSLGEYAQFSFQLHLLLQEMPSEDRRHVQDENTDYLLYLAEIGLFALDKIPNTVISTFPLLQLKNATDELVKQGQRVGVLQLKMDELIAKFTSARDELVFTKQRRATSEQIVEEFMEPPQCFREVHVLPLPEEIRSDLVRPFLRPNVIRGAYRDWEHYLDVQFRLLKEDFVGPLRSGVSGYCSGVSDKDVSKIRVYERVYVLGPVCLNSGMGFQIRFDVSRLRRVNWEHSRRLIFGSLLCLSRGGNQFETNIFATVMQRDLKLLCEGLITIKFEGDVDGFEINPNDEFTMVESTAYFEAYRHILVGLQNIAPDRIPFKKYIIECSLQQVLAPRYLRTGISTEFDMQETLGTKETMKISVTNPRAWPNASRTCLDPSQLGALKMALSQEMSIIQGPPGTGKTFIGLKIVQALLQNRLVWDTDETHPILVMCYTNHALDQFLEQISGIEINGKNPSIVRIGGRCKNESLKNCVLSQKVQQCHNDRSFPPKIYRPWVQYRKDMYQMKNEMDGFVKQMDTSDGKILKLSTLHEIIRHDHYDQLYSLSDYSGVGKEIEYWLGLWYPQQPVQITQQGTKRELGIENEDTASEIGDDFVDVDKEAQLLEDERISEGEDIVLHSPLNKELHTLPAAPSASTSAPNMVWQTVQIPNKERSKKMNRGLRYEPMPEDQANNIRDITSLSDMEKWQLYKYWVNKHLVQMKANLSQRGTKYNEYCQFFNEAQHKLEEHIIQHVDVVGMTTTGAAKHHHLLNSARARILIVEEAAEVLESHIIASLTPTIQQLVMIGDHKQLKPKPSNYELVKKYDFDVSLFERLAGNKMPCSSLELQHRMRPEIATLLRPHFYERLLDHNSVRGYGSIKGVQKNMFFIDHDFPEKSNEGTDSYSHANVHEADFLVALCRYLLLQEYKPGQITILTMYRGQLLELRQRLRKDPFEGVRVAAVDDFQGEENEIILLSLVRSNSDGDIGFLKVDNRICVSLSRAKMGFYVIGNLAMLRNSDNTAWPRILSEVDSQGCMGKALPLCCQLHTEVLVHAVRSEDFSRCPEGGCTKMCGIRLKCGHVCSRICHPNDREHLKYHCHKPCSKELPCGHKCQSKCYDCAQGCQPCLVRVTKVIPQCRHNILAPCSKDPNEIVCREMCARQLPCGHQCQEKCSDQCTANCKEKVTVTLSCGHKHEHLCHISVKDNKCPNPCNTLLECGHGCTGTCGRCFRGRLHVQCSHHCGRTLACGHTCNFPCTGNCPPCNQECRNYCIHSRCPKACYEVCSPCAEPCCWSCDHYKCTKQCGELCSRPECNEPCEKLLSCGHPCIGLCGEKCPSRCRICDEKVVKELFFGTEDEDDAKFIELQDCHHVFEVSGLDKWVKNTESTDADQPIQFKKCPRCSVEIRRHLRYGNVVKQTLVDLEQIKLKTQTIDVKTLKSLYNEVNQKLRKNNSQDKVMANMNSFASILGITSSISTQPQLFPIHMNTIQNQLLLIPQLASIYSRLDQVASAMTLAIGLSKQGLIEAVEILHAYIMQSTLFDQQLHDIEYEMRRLNCTIALFEVRCKLSSPGHNPSQAEVDDVTKCVIEVYRSGQKGYPKLEKEKEVEVNAFVSCLKEKYHLDGLTEAERTEIVKAVGLSEGHWFKCSKGHYYCIGECGGAMEIGKCPECGDQIGGERHKLIHGNELASEMDGASHAAWSDAANMAAN